MNKKLFKQKLCSKRIVVIKTLSNSELADNCNIITKILSHNIAITEYIIIYNLV